MVDFLEREGAEVVTEGKFYLQARFLHTCRSVMVPAYDDPILWEGHGSMIPEIARQLPEGIKPDAIFCSVGGGGLFGGVMRGAKSIGWDDVALIALETTGSNCLYQSLALNDGRFAPGMLSSDDVRVEHDVTHDVKIAHLSTLTSRASSLGASFASAGVVKMALSRKGSIKSVCVPDELATQAALLFAEDHKILVELACSTTLTPAYVPAMFNKLVPPSSSGLARTVVFVVCGGFKVSLREMEEYSSIVEADKMHRRQWNMFCNGEEWVIDK